MTPCTLAPRRTLPTLPESRAASFPAAASRSGSFPAAASRAASSAVRRPKLRVLFAALLVIGCGIAPGASPAWADRTLTRELTYPAPEVSLTDDGAWSRVDLEGGRLAIWPGEPALPSLRLRLPLEAKERVSQVRLVVLEQEDLALDAPLQPYQGGRSTAQEDPPWVDPDPAVYETDALFPSAPASLVSEFELSTGRRYAVVRIYPLRYQPLAQQLTVVRRARLVVELTTAARETPEELRTDRWPATPGRLLTHEPGLRATETPSVDGSAVRYVIITGPDASMAEAWQPLADWKTACGHPARVVTTDWVRDHYPGGSDLAEKIRLFLRDAYLHWGLQAALLGGDTELVPTRTVGTSPYGVASDYYYACLDGTWDENGNGIFGERPADGPDLVPEIQVGRVSARDADQVGTYLEKYFIYVQTPPDDGYLDRGLMLGEVLFSAAWSRNGRGAGIPDCNDCDEPDCRVYQGSTVCVVWDGADDCFDVETSMRAAGYPGTLDFLLERSEYWAVNEPVHVSEVENRESTIDYLSEGYNFVLHVGHGAWDRWAVGDGRLIKSDFPLLTNGQAGRYFWAYGVNCSSAGIHLDSFGEQLVLLPGHGALAYIGSTYASSAGWAAALAGDFFHYLYVDEGGTLGDGFYGSAAANAAIGDRIIYGRALLGEPTMMVWRATPGEMDVAFDAAVPVGRDTLEVVVTDAVVTTPVAGARVCLQKEGEAYAVALTGEDGRAALPFFPATEGAFDLTVISPAHRPARLQRTVAGTSTTAALRIEEVALVDDGSAGSSGNGNGALEVGETARLRLQLANVGAGASGAITAHLSVDAPEGLLTVPDEDAALDAIGPGSAAEDAEAFLVSVWDAVGDLVFGDTDRITATLSIEIVHEGDAWVFTTPLEISRARLTLAANTWEWTAADSARLWVGVANRGKATGSRLRGYLAPAEGDTAIVSVMPASLDLPDLAPDEELQVGPFTVRTTGSGVGQMIFTVTDTLSDPSVVLHEAHITTAQPAPATDLSAIGLPEAIELRWEAPDAGGGSASDSLGGYIVSRAQEGAGAFEPAHAGVLRDHRYLLDDLLEDLTRYSYVVQSVDAGGNTSAPSETLSASTSPGLAGGWPQQFIYSSQVASPLVCELDCLPDEEGCTHVRELFFGGDLLNGFHGNGTEITDGDENVISQGPFSQDPAGGETKYEFRGKAAAADLDGDGTMEVLAVSRQQRTLICWSPAGGEPVWEVDLPVWIAWRTPVLADLDNDGSLEVIVTAGESGHEGIYVFNHDGSPYLSGTDGRLADFQDNYLYHSPAVGDVDADGYADIVMATRTGRLYVIDGRTGAALPGFQNLRFDAWHDGEISRASPTLANVDGQPGDEIFVVTRGYLWTFGQQASFRWEPRAFSEPFSLSSSADLYPEPALGDIDGDGHIDIAIADAGGSLWAWRAVDGAQLESFPVTLERGPTVRYGSCILVNVDSDSLPEIVFGDSKGRIYAYTADGTAARGFPLEFGGNMGKMSLAAWDVDGDGYQNLIAQAEGVLKLGVYHLAGAEFDPAHNPWPMRHRDARNTGRYAEPSPRLTVTLDRAEVSGGGVATLEWSCPGAPSALFASEVRRWGPAVDGLPGEMVWVGRVIGNGHTGPQPYGITDSLPEPGTYAYCINPVGFDGWEQTGLSVTLELTEEPESRFGIDWVGPSPGLTGKPQVVRFQLPTAAGTTLPVKLRVYDLQGRLQRTLLDGPASTGEISLEWHGRDDGGRILPTGIYFMRLEAAGQEQVRRVVLVH